MIRPTGAEFAARWWEFRPTGRGVIAMTASTLLLMFAKDWPAWVSVLVIVGIAAALSSMFAALELWNDAEPDAPGNDQDAEPEPEEVTPAGAAFAVDTTPEEGRHVSLKPKAGEQ